MWSVLGFVGLRCSVKVDEDGQCPASLGEGELDQNSQHDPLVTVAEGGVGVGGADRIAVSVFAVNALTFVAINGVVSDQDDRPGGNEVPEDERCQCTPELQGGPRCA
jgi:hypothetical protein